MKFVSWNVNGLRACINKGFLDTFHSPNADFFCLQETKLQAGQIELDLPGYEQYWNYAEKKGYSGTAIFTKHTPLSVTYGVGVEELDTEGRLITLEYEEFYLVNCYTPNAQRELARIDHRLRWEAALQEYFSGLDAKKPVIYCGDLNVAHNEIDLKNPSANRGNAGFSDEERGAFSALLERGFTDSFRHLYPNVTGAYSWWSYMFNARKNNAGWRIDYFVVSDRLAGSIYDATIHPDVMGSDHCPVGLDLNISCNGSIWTTDTTMPSEPEKKADGDSSAGHIRKLIPVAVSLVLTAALLIPIFAITHRPTSEPSEPSTKPTAQPIQLTVPDTFTGVVSEIISHGNTISFFQGPTKPTDSTINFYYTNGTTKWTLELNETRVMTNVTFYVELVFDANYLFYSDNKPIVTVTNCDRHALYYYYGSDNSIAGCFIVGYSEQDFQLNVQVQYTEDEASPSLLSSHSIEIDPSQGLPNWTADELLHHIKHNTNIKNWLFSSVSFEQLLAGNVHVQEFCKRPEAISLLLNDYRNGNEYFSVSYLLLSHEPLNSQMTEDEIRQFEEIKQELMP